jgi:hypothetical protein
MKSLSKAKEEAMRRDMQEANEKYRYIASEIVRGMTNSKLTKEQQDHLLSVAEIVMKNKFGFYKKYEGIY